MLMQCLCNLLCRCLPGRKTAEGQTAADAPAPVADKPVEGDRQRDSKRSGNAGGRST